MNANTRLRLWKETRALLPMWAAVAALMALPFLLQLRDPRSFSIASFIFGCALLGPVCIGHEFNHRTMGALLAQPVSRRRLWWEKLLLLGAALLSLAWWLAFLVPATWGRPGSVSSADATMAIVLFYLPHPLTAWLLALFGFCAGPAFTLLARSMIGGVALTFLFPWALLLIGMMLHGILFSPEQADLSLIEDTVEGFLLCYLLVSAGVSSGTLFLVGCRRFQRLEDVNLLAQEFAAPRQFDSLFARMTTVLAPGRDSQLANLLRKEVRLQRPAVFVAVFLVALWLAFIVARRVHPALGAEVLIVPSILLGLGIPVIAGIVAVAEERSLGVHEWHLTLPVSARRQWGVKVLVALGVNVAFGILLPGLLAHASAWLANNPQLVAEIPGRNVSPLLIANAVIFCAALYASTASSNFMRALVGAIGIFAAATVVLNVANSGARMLAAANNYDLPLGLADSWSALEKLQWSYRNLLPMGWVGLTAWFVSVGFQSFRQPPEPAARVAYRLAPLLLCATILLSLTFTWEILGGKYEHQLENKRLRQKAE